MQSRQVALSNVWTSVCALHRHQCDVNCIDDMCVQMAKLEQRLQANKKEAAAQSSAMEQAYKAQLTAKEGDIQGLKVQMEVLQSSAGADRAQALSSLQVGQGFPVCTCSGFVNSNDGRGMCTWSEEVAFYSMS